MQHTRSTLDKRARDSIAGRHRRARIAVTLLVLGISVLGYLQRASARLVLVYVGLVVVLVLVIMHAEQQRCPRCETPLTRRRWWGQDYAPTCPGCDYPID